VPVPRLRSALAVAAAATLLLAPAPAQADPAPASYQLTGDEGGSRFEGIGYDRRTGAFYVSETTGGEVHRGDVREPATAQWLAGDGTDGRFTARGITVDDAGRVYIAGGPNGIDHPGAPDLWVYARNGTLLAALDTGVDGAFLNDVAIGPDGAAYFTNSNAPQVFRVARTRDAWSVSTWVDATGTIPTAAGFNLGGIVATPDGRALLVAQGNVGKLWRFDLRTRAVTEVAVAGADLRGSDGLVLQGTRLTAVRNFSRALTTVRMSGGWTAASLVAEVPTAADRVLTTAKIARGRLLAVDSKFDENPPQPPYEVLSLRLP
jgi:sugar lactone lactonase YvrE